MRPKTTEDIFELMESYVVSAALGAAMELGLFWMLAAEPVSPPEIAQRLDIPLNRCQNWLRLLCKFDLLNERAQGYTTSSLAQELILEAYNQSTWAYLAREERNKFPALRDLTHNLSYPRSLWKKHRLRFPDYLEHVLRDPAEAASYTRSLYELHIPLGEQLAAALDLQGVKRLMDLGGGSGVVSFALSRRYPDLACTVVDFKNVCAAAQIIARENGLENRIIYISTDYLRDELPGGFDMVLFCDAGPYTPALLRKILGALNPKGRLVIVEQFAPDRYIAASSHISSAFLDSLDKPAYSNDFITVDAVQSRLRQAGFRDLTTTPLRCEDQLRWNWGWIVLEGRK
jgi:predicted O-methyltransferase YrrM